jgi:murein tripeptide amidase MpaA
LLIEVKKHDTTTRLKQAQPQPDKVTKQIIENIKKKKTQNTNLNRWETKENHETGESNNKMNDKK